MKLEDRFKNIKMGGKFKATLVNAKTFVIEKEAEAINVVLDVAYAFMATGEQPSSANIMHLGTGSTTPSFTATGLSVPVFSKGASFTRISTLKWQYSAYFESNEANFALTELGMAWLDGPYLNWAQFKDLNNNPITIDKTDSQVLSVTMEFEIVRL